MMTVLAYMVLTAVDPNHTGWFYVLPIFLDLAIISALSEWKK